MISAFRCRHILLVVVDEQVAGLAKDRWKFELQNVPNDSMIDFGVAVDENVPEGDDPPICEATAGSVLASWASASPTISNCRSTADRNMGSAA